MAKVWNGIFFIENCALLIRKEFVEKNNNKYLGILVADIIKQRDTKVYVRRTRKRQETKLRNRKSNQSKKKKKMEQFSFIDTMDLS